MHARIQAGTHGACMYKPTHTFSPKTGAEIDVSWGFHLMLNRIETPLKLIFLLGIPRCFLLQTFVSLPLSLLP